MADTIDHRMPDRALQCMPGLADLAAIRTWTGFRAATPDNLPLMGITTSLATGKLVADRILHRTPAIAAEPYLPGRKQEAHG